MRHSIRTSTRRNFLRVTAGACAFGPFFLFRSKAFAGRSGLKIAKWAHFLPEFDPWFEAMAEQWGRKYDTAVSVDEIPVENVYGVAKTETGAADGHDLFIFPWPPAEFQQSAIDHGEIYQAAAGKYGAIPQIAFKSTINFRTKKYFAFADSWIPTPLLYFEDCWQPANMPYGPLAYESLRSGGHRVREKVGLPCGLALSSTLEGNITCHTMLYAFGGTLINARGQVRIDARTTAALTYAKYLYQDAGTTEELGWGSAGNVRAMLDRKVSCTMNAISLLRTAEKEKPELAKQMRIQPPLLGSYGVTSFPHATNCSVIWEFSKNQAGAKQFLIDMIDQSRQVYETSGGCNFPAYQKALPDLAVRLAKDPQADPPDKYHELKDALHWTPNLGAPGVVTPTWMEAFNTFVAPRMFRSAVLGDMSVLEAAHAAEAEVKQIAEKWKDV